MVFFSRGHVGKSSLHKASGDTFHPLLELLFSHKDDAFLADFSDSTARPSKSLVGR